MAQRKRASRLSPEQRTADIMSAARAVFVERGFNDTTIAEIADRAGVVEGSIYRYFRSKRELLFKVAEEWFEEMISDDMEAFGAVSGAFNRLRFIVYRHLRTIHEQPELSRLVFLHLRPDPDYRETHLFALNQAYTARITDVVREGISAGEFREGVSPSLVRDLVFGCVEHRTWAFLRKEGDFDPEELVESLTDMVFLGLRAEVPPGPMESLVDRMEAAVSSLTALADRGKAGA